MKRPERVRVLGKRVTISYVQTGDEVLKGDGGDAGTGINDPDAQAIWVKDGLPFETEQDVVLHETIHILEAYMDIDLSEQAVSKLATGLLSVIKDNPGYWRYLATKERDRGPKAI